MTLLKWARKYSKKKIEIQNKQKNEVQNWKCINKAKVEMLIESELLLLITLRRRRKPRVWARQVYWESTIPLTATSVSLKWFSGLCIVTFLLLFGLFQKQPPRGAPRKRCSEKIRRTPMPKCDFNKVAKQPSWNHFSTWVFSCKFAGYFQNTFY